MSKAPSTPPPDAADDTFDTSMPWGVLLPFPGQWATFQVVYDLYQVEAYMDRESAWMRDTWAAKVAVDALEAAADALPDGPEKIAANDEWLTAFRAWQRRGALHKLAFFVHEIRWPLRTAPPDPQVPEQWDKWPIFILEWIAGAGFQAARAVIWDPKLLIGSTLLPVGPPS